MVNHVKILVGKAIDVIAVVGVVQVAERYIIIVAVPQGDISIGALRAGGMSVGMRDFYVPRSIFSRSIFINIVLDANASCVYKSTLLRTTIREGCGPSLSGN